MGDILHYRTITSTANAATVPIGLAVAQIIKISRWGEQKDYGGAFSSFTFNGNNWTLTPGIKRLTFGGDYPFTVGEVIHIIYKVST